MRPALGTACRVAALCAAALACALASGCATAPPDDSAAVAAATDRAQVALEPVAVTAPADTAPSPASAPAAGMTSPAAPPGADAAGNPPAGAGAPFDAGGSMIFEPGLYHCELNRRVIIRRIGADGRTMVLNWSNKDYAMVPVHSRAGAIRYEDVKAGLAWIVIVGKSMLLDTRKGQQLANECRL